MFNTGFPPEWSTLKKLVWLVGSGIAGAAAGIWKTVSGTLIHITDALASPMQKCEVTLEPIQEGSGDPSPTNVRPITGWTGCEVNVANENLFDKSKVGTLGILTWAYENGGILLKAGQSYVLSVASAGSSGLADSISIYTADEATQLANSYSKTLVYNPTADIKVCFRFYKSTGVTQEAIDTVQLNLGTTALPYEDHNGTTLSVTFPDSAGTVYGGTYDFVSGGLKPYKEYDSYNGETLTGEWMSSIDKYVSGTTPTIGAQVVDLDGYDTTVQLTPQEISTLAGENNVWSNTNADTTIIYKAQAE